MQILLHWCTGLNFVTRERLIFGHAGLIKIAVIDFTLRANQVSAHSILPLLRKWSLLRIAGAILVYRALLQEFGASIIIMHLVVLEQCV